MASRRFDAPERQSLTSRGSSDGMPGLGDRMSSDWFRLVVAREWRDGRRVDSIGIELHDATFLTCMPSSLEINERQNRPIV
jgi:hypothetical protein